MRAVTGAEPALQKMALMSRMAQKQWAENGWRPGPHTQLLAGACRRVWQGKQEMPKRASYLHSAVPLPWEFCFCSHGLTGTVGRINNPHVELERPLQAGLQPLPITFMGGEREEPPGQHSTVYRPTRS